MSLNSSLRLIAVAKSSWHYLHHPRPAKADPVPHCERQATAWLSPTEQHNSGLRNSSVGTTPSTVTAASPGTPRSQSSTAPGSTSSRPDRPPSTRHGPRTPNASQPVLRHPGCLSKSGSTTPPGGSKQVDTYRRRSRVRRTLQCDLDKRRDSHREERGDGDGERGHRGWSCTGGAGEGPQSVTHASGRSPGRPMRTWPSARFNSDDSDTPND